MTSSGAGPAGVEAYPYWIGICSGGPWSDGRVWRVKGEPTSSPETFGLYKTDQPGVWTAAVEVTKGRVQQIAVTEADR